jgi:hypothetical protein
MSVYQILVTPWSSELAKYLKTNTYELVTAPTAVNQKFIRCKDIYIICHFTSNRQLSKSHLREILGLFEGRSVKVSFYFPLKNWKCGSTIDIFKIFKVILGSDFPSVRLIIHKDRKGDSLRGESFTTGDLTSALQISTNPAFILRDVQLYSISELVYDLEAMIPFRSAIKDDDAERTAENTPLNSPPMLRQASGSSNDNIV